VVRSRLASSALLVLLLAGCSGGPAPERPVPPATESATPTPSVAPPVFPNVPIHGTELQPARVAVPPVRVAVPAASIDVAVEPVGVLPDGEMELPANTAVAGWYRFGPDPASGAGATVVAAHVDSLKYGLGPFSRLKELGVGSTVTVTTADGTVYDYAITSNARVAKEEIDLDGVFTRTGPALLVLMTCGGQFDYETGHYLDNILVTATPVAR
jgi:hypothetical protein